MEPEVYINKLKIDPNLHMALRILAERIRRLQARVVPVEGILGIKDSAGLPSGTPVIYYQEIYDIVNSVSLAQRLKFYLDGFQVIDNPTENSTIIAPFYNTISGPGGIATQRYYLEFFGDLVDVDDVPPVTRVTFRLKETSGPQVLGIGAIADGEFLKRVGTDIVGAAGGGGGGEANTATNVGIGGVSIVDGKVGVDLQFRSIDAPGTIGGVSVVFNALNKSVYIDGVAATTAAKGVVELATNGENAANVVVQGNDGRLSDSRNPLGHHTNHEALGSDQIKLDDLAAPDNNTDLDASITKHGLMQKYPNNTTDYLRADAVFAALPSGSTVAKGIVELATDGENAANVVVQGNDSRLSNDRNPNVHDIITKHNGFPGGTANFLRADGTFAAPPGGSSQITKLTGASGAAGADETWLVLTANSADITGTGLTTVATLTGVGAGRYRISIMLIYQTTAVTTGIDVAVNHTGTTTQWVMEHRFASTGNAATTAAATEASNNATGSTYEAQGQRTKNAVIGAGTVSVDASNTDMISIIEGFFTVTVSGDIQVKMAAEAAGLVCRAVAGTNIVLRKFN